MIWHATSQRSAEETRSRRPEHSISIGWSNNHVNNLHVKHVTWDANSNYLHVSNHADDNSCFATCWNAGCRNASKNHTWNLEVAGTEEVTSFGTDGTSGPPCRECFEAAIPLLGGNSYQARLWRHTDVAHAQPFDDNHVFKSRALLIYNIYTLHVCIYI